MALLQVQAPSSSAGGGWAGSVRLQGPPNLSCRSYKIGKADNELGIFAGKYVCEQTRRSHFQEGQPIVTREASDGRILEAVHFRLHPSLIAGWPLAADGKLFRGRYARSDKTESVV